MNLKFIIFLFMFSSISFAKEINWVSPEKLEHSNSLYCPEINDYIKSFELNKGDNFQVWKFDINNDGKIDYLIHSLVRDFCGTAGCQTKLFLNNGSHCKSVYFPHLQFNQKLGFDKNNVLIPREKCNVWLYKNFNLEYVKEIEKCE